MKTVTFISRKYKELNVVLDPRTYQMDAGRQTMIGLNGKFPQGMSVQFHDGVYTTSDPAIIDALRAHMSYGMGFYSNEPGEAVQPTDEALRNENEKKQLATEAGAICPECGKKFKSDFGLQGHLKSHTKE